MQKLLRLLAALMLCLSVGAVTGCKKQDEDAARKKQEEELDKKVEEKANEILNK